jgi:WD40 repeat protein
VAATGAAVLINHLIGLHEIKQERDRAVQAEERAKLNEAAAQDQKREADDAKNRAEKQRDELAVLNDQLRRLTYVADMNLARRAWDENNPVLAQDLLERHRPKPGEADVRGFEWRYLRRLAHSELFTVKAHVGLVSTVAYADGGKKLVSVGGRQAEYFDKASGEIRLWNAATGAPLPLRLKDTTDKVCAGAVSPDGKLLAVGCRDKLVRVWNLESGELIAKLEGHAVDVVQEVVFSLDGKHLASRARPAVPAGLPNLGEIRIWDLDAGKAIVPIDKLSFNATPLSFSPDGKRLASASARSVLTVWDTASGHELLVKDMENPVDTIAFSPDSKHLAVAPFATDALSRSTQLLRILDAETGDLIRTCPTSISYGLSLAYSRDGKLLAVGGSEGIVELWNVESGQLVRTFKGHVQEVFSVVCSPDGTHLASAGADGCVKVWDTTGNGDIISIPRDREHFSGIFLSPDGRMAITRVGPETMQLWNAATGKALGNTLRHEHKVVSQRFTADGKRLAITDDAKNVTIWDVATGKAVQTFKHDGPEGFIRIELSSDGKWLACRGPADVLKVWNTEKGLEFRAFPGLKKWPGQWGFSPDNTRFAAGDANGALKMWDLATGREMWTTDFMGVHLSSLQFSPDGKQLAIGVGPSDSKLGAFAGMMRLGEARILDAESGRDVSMPLKGHTGDVSYLRYSPDGKRLVAAGADGSVRIWDVATGQETLRLTGHIRQVTGLAFTPDGNRLLSSGGIVRIWDATPLPE